MRGGLLGPLLGTAEIDRAASAWASQKRNLGAAEVETFLHEGLAVGALLT